MSTEEEKIASEFEIRNKLGLHARAATLLVELASSFESEILIEKNGEQVDCKSLMGILMLAAGYKTRIKIHASGDDAEEALDAIEELIEKKFHEE